jgi:hypothetical protein
MAMGELGRYYGEGSVTVRWGAHVDVVGPCDFLTWRQCLCVCVCVCVRCGDQTIYTNFMYRAVNVALLVLLLCQKGDLKHVRYIYIYIYIYIYVYISFKTFFYVVRHLDSTASYLPTSLHLAFCRSWSSLYLPSSFSSIFLVLSFVSAFTSMLFWVIFLLSFSEHGRTI